MSRLYLSFERNAFDVFREAVAAAGRQCVDTGDTNGLAVFVVDDPDSKFVASMLTLIASNVLRSGALVEDRLAPGDLWIATEWWKKFLVEKSLISSGVFSFDDQVTGVDAGGRRFFVFRASPEKESPFTEYDPRSFARDSVPCEHVLTDPRKYYGDFTDEFTGGANALFAAGREAADARALGADRVVLGSPEDFGFALDTTGENVNAWRRKRVIHVEAVGFTFGNCSPAHELASQHGVATAFDDLEHWLNDWQPNYRFGVAMILIGLDDPPVVIPMGSVYQQPTMNTSVQNLAIAQAKSVMVQAGATVPIVLPAYCLNPSFSPPHGPVVPTSLVYTAASGSQSSVWSGIHDRYQERP